MPVLSDKLSIPWKQAIALALSTASIIWYVAGVKTDLSVQIATIGQELKDHIKYTGNNSLSQN